MSHRVEYQWAAFHVPGAPLGLAQDRYIIAIEGGDNAVRCGIHGRRARSWDACMVGDRSQILRQAVQAAGACENGSLRPHGRRWMPETYIRQIRYLLDAAAATPPQGSWHARLRAAADHPAIEALRQLGLEPRLETRDGQQQALVEPRPEHHGAYFALIDCYASELPAQYWIEVCGLPTS
jgi:hypothetical protein